MSRPILLQPAEGTGDAELVARALEGDRWSREMLYRRHAGYLLAMTIRLLASRSDAEEVVQDTFVTGFVQLHTLREHGAVRAWLAQIAVSLVRRRIRRWRLMRVLGIDRGASDATLEALSSPGLDAEGHAELALIDKVLSRMRSDLRIAWMLRRVDGLELTEVASYCGCSLATAKRRISEADVVIRRHVGHLEAGE